MRGRLIHPFRIELAQLDTAASASVPNGGYDPVFREPRAVPDGTLTGASTRRETPLELAAQIEPATFNLARTAVGGQQRDARFVVVVHFQELEDRGLIDSTGQPMVRIGDRLVAVRTMEGELVMQIPTPPGLYLRETLPIGFGLGGRRNLLQLEFVSRATAR
jgi:hypothetical protein